MLTALTPFSNTVLHRFTSLARHYTFPQLPALRCTHALIRHDSPVLLLLNAGLICHLCVSWIVDSVPVSLLGLSGTLSLSLEGTGIPAVFMSEASWVTTPLGAVVLCYNIYSLPTALKSLHLACASSFIFQITTIILWYCLNCKVLIYRFHNSFKTYLMYITSYNVPLWCKMPSGTLVKGQGCPELISDYGAQRAHL
jgi:hypothetical protein